MKPINREILALTIPSVVTNITTPLLSLVDTALTGHMGSAVYLAAIAIGGTMFNLLYWLVGFLRMSASGLTAQAYGAGNLEGQALVLRRECVWAVAIGVTFIALSPWLAPLLIGYTDPSPESSALALRYFDIVIWGAPAVLTNYALTGWFLGRQNARVPMWTAFAVNVSNIAISVALVFGLDMHIEGVAIGTLVAQWIGAVVLVASARRQHLPRVAWQKVMRPTDMARFATLNVPLFLRTLCMIAVTFWFTRVGALQGNVVLGVNALLMQLFLLFSYVMDGFAFAAEALTGRYVGARDGEHLARTVRATMRWGLFMALLFTLLYTVGGGWLLGMLTDDGDILQASAEYVAWGFAIPLAGFAAFAWDGIYVGAMLNKAMMLTLALSAAMFFICWALLVPLVGNHGLWAAFIAYMVTRSLAQTLLWPRLKSKILIGK